MISDLLLFFFQAEDGIRDLVRSRGLGDVYKRQPFYVRDFRELYAENPNKAVKASTKALEECLRTLIIDTLDEEEDTFIKPVSYTHLTLPTSDLV